MKMTSWLVFFPRFAFVGLIYALRVPLGWEEAEIGVKFAEWSRGQQACQTHTRER